MRWAAGDEAFLSGVGNPLPQKLFLPLISLCSSSSGASIKQTIKELPHSYSVIIFLGPEDAGPPQWSVWRPLKPLLSLDL